MLTTISCFDPAHITLLTAPCCPLRRQPPTSAHCRCRSRAHKLNSIRTAATAWRLQAMAQAFRCWHLDMQRWRHVYQTLRCIAGKTAVALVTTDLNRCDLPRCPPVPGAALCPLQEGCHLQSMFPWAASHLDGIGKVLVEPWHGVVTDGRCTQRSAQCARLCRRQQLIAGGTLPLQLPSEHGNPQWLGASR